MMAEKSKDTKVSETQENKKKTEEKVSKEEVLSSKLKELTDTVSTLKTEKEDFYNKYLRALADTENKRKRFEKEKQDILNFGLESLLKDLLPLIDSLNKALQVDDKESSSMRQGVELVRKQLLEFLEKKGVEAIETNDNAFDPEFHQAIQKEESEEVTSPTIKTEYVKGYLLNGRLLRPSIVRVVIPTEKKT